MTTPEDDPTDAEFKTNLLQVVPSMRAFARSLTGNREFADDLTQDALVNAWRSRKTFTPGTNLKAWTFTILRNQFYSDKRRSWRLTSLDEEAAHQLPAPNDQQDWAIDLSYVARALRSLPDDQREALILTGVGGFSYDEVARICNCAQGTVKSRVARGREKLMSMLENNSEVTVAVRGRAEDAAQDIIGQLDALTPVGNIKTSKKSRKTS